MISKNDKLKYCCLRQETINGCFKQACGNGDLELVKYFLFDKNIIQADLDKAGPYGLIQAAGAQHNDIVKFLIEGKELKKHVSINIHKGELLHIAVKTKNLDLVDYLLSKSKKLNFNQNEDQIFKSLMSQFNFNKEIIQTLIVDYQLIKTQTIIDFLDEKNFHIEQKKIVNDWFEIRALKETLDLVLETDARKKNQPLKKRKI